MNTKLLPAIFIATLLVFSAEISKATLVTFAEADTFDGDSAGSFAGPFGGYFIETVSLAPNGVVNTTSANGGDLGINATGADTADRFDNGESWTFRFPATAIEFQGIDFDNFSTVTETFTLSSAAWVGLVLAPTIPEITFNSALGAFTFTSGTASDDFSLINLTGGVPIFTPANTSILLSYSGGVSDNAHLADFTFTAVPEPSIALLLGLGGFLMWRRRRSGK